MRNAQRRVTLFQHTAARRRLAIGGSVTARDELFQHTAARRRLGAFGELLDTRTGFNTQPPEGGWLWIILPSPTKIAVSTHSRPKAAGPLLIVPNSDHKVSTHSRPKAAGEAVATTGIEAIVSTHSRPKAAGASLKSLAPSGFAAPISLSSQEKREREYNTAFFVTPAFTIS